MGLSKEIIYRGFILKPDDVGVDGSEGEIKVGLTSKKLHVYLDGALRNVVTESQVQTLSNKTLTSPVINTGVSGTAISTDGTLAANSDTLLASQKAVKTYADSVGTTAATNLSAHINDATDAHDASAISSVPSGNLAATDVQTALNELQTDVDSRALQTSLDTTNTNLSNHIADAVDAHDASAISSVPSGNLAATDVQTALDELQTDVDTRATTAALNAHINDATDAHAATAITNTPAGTIAATTVQAAINELDTDIQDHINDAVGAHAATAISNSPSGNLAATTVQAALNELQGDIDTINTDLADDVEGPASSTDNAVARFDGITGKLLQNSVVTVSDAGVIAGATGLTSSGTVNLTGTTTINSTIFNGPVAEATTSDGTSGTAVTVDVSTSGSIIRLTSGTLVSVAMISGSSSGKNLTLFNDTGNTITILNESGATAANRILTGTADDVEVENDACLILKYMLDSRWHIVGGSGGGGASTVKITAGENLTANDYVYISPGTGNDSGRTAGQLYKADASVDERVDVIGIVKATVTSGSLTTVIITGPAKNQSGLTAGALYYLSASSPGAITTTPPSTNGQWVVTVGQAASATQMIINPVAGASAIYVSDSEYSVTVANNQSSPTNLGTAVFDPTTTRAFIIDYSIYRKTDTASSAVAAVGQLRGVYNTQSTTFYLSDDFAGQDSGIIFSITGAGQLQYTSTNIAGSNYTGTMNYYIRNTMSV
jgi:hypothetical protein